MSRRRAMLSKEGLRRAEAMFESMETRMNRQKAALTRIVNANIEAVSALHEIAHDERLDADGMRKRAAESLALIEHMRVAAAAVPEDQAESKEPETEGEAHD